MAQNKQIQYEPVGICPKLIEVSADGNRRIQEVRFYGGCPGNTLGIASLVKGRTIDEVKQSLRGIPCGTRGTSCPDQLCRALDELDKLYLGEN